MANLKDLKIRIDSVKSTQKITSAMKMVAAAKLRRAQESAEAARPYAVRMERMLGSLAQSVDNTEGAPKLLAGTGANKTHLLVAFTADRGLCGGFNSSIVRQVRTMIMDLKAAEKTVKVFCVGRKGHDVLKREFPAEITENTTATTLNHVLGSDICSGACGTLCLHPSSAPSVVPTITPTDAAGKSTLLGLMPRLLLPM